MQTQTQQIIQVNANDIITASESTTLPESINNLLVSLGRSIDIEQTTRSQVQTLFVQEGQRALDKIDQMVSSIASNSFTEFTANVRVDEVDVIGEMVDKSIDAMESMKSTSLMNPNQSGLIHTIRNMFVKPIKEFNTKRETVQSFLNGITESLKASINTLNNDTQSLEKMYNDTLSSISVFNSVLLSGIEELKKLYLTTIPQLEKELSENPADILLSEKLSDVRNFADKLEKKMTRVYSARAIAIRQLPQIRMMQNYNSTEAETINDLINTGIPTWSQQTALIVSQLRTRRQVEARQKVTSMINTTIQRNAELMADNAIAIAHGSNDDFISIDTISILNNKLTDTFTEVKRINNEGRDMRRRSVNEISQMNDSFLNFINSN
jgi:uncharacterized protein YaaN involved in tellurite resistance